MPGVDQQENLQNTLFLRLYVANEEALSGFVRSLVPTREDSREVMQEVAVVLWRKFSELADPSDFRKWAFGVARMEALSFIRDRARDRHVFGDEAIAILANEAEEGGDYFEAARGALDECVAKLENDHRDLLEQAYAPGARIDAIAAASGRSPMSLYKALHRIRLMLVDCTSRALAGRECV